MEDTASKTYVFGQDNNLLSAIMPYLSQRGIDASTLALLNNNGGFGGNNFWWIIFLLFFWGGNGNWGNNNNGTGFLANQISNDTGRDLLLQSIQGNGTAIGQLAATLNSDFNTVNTAINTLQSAIQSVGNQVGLSRLQIQNAIQAGDASLAKQLCESFCEVRHSAIEQGYQAQLRTVEQTNQLGAQADRNTGSIVSAIADLKTTMTDQFCEVKEREYQNKIESLSAMNTTLRNQIDNASQTAQIAQMIQPLQKEIDAVRAAQPSTTTIQYPQLVGVPAYSVYGNGYNPYLGYQNYNGSYWG